MWSFDHFLLRFRMSVAIVGHQMGNMLVEVLNLGEKRYVESLQMESLTCWGMWWIKSYSINVATMTWKCFSRYFENDRIRTAYLGWNVNRTASSGHQYNLLVSVRTDQPSVWDIQEGGIVYNTQWKWCHYIPIDVRHKLGINSLRLCTVKKNLIKVADIVSPVSWNSTSQLRWNLVSVEADELFQHLNFMMGGRKSW